MENSLWTGLLEWLEVLQESHNDGRCPNVLAVLLVYSLRRREMCCKCVMYLSKIDCPYTLGNRIHITYSAVHVGRGQRTLNIIPSIDCDIPLCLKEARQADKEGLCSTP